MSERTAGNPEQDFDYYKVKPTESLWDVAFDHVLPPGSDPSVQRCMNNILEANDGKFYGQDWIKIPKPCDPQDGPEMALNKAARELSHVFAYSNDAFDAASRLSEELLPRLGTLQTSNREYNYLISNIHKQLENLPLQQGVRVGAEHWNSATKTWDNVYVADKDYPNSPPVRIVQPDNTIRGMSDDRLQQLRNMGLQVNSQSFIKEFMHLNGLKSQQDLEVGKPVVFPY